MRLPPRLLRPTLVKITMMQGTEGDNKFVTDLLAHALALRIFQMVGVGRLATAYQTGKLSHLLQMGLVAITLFLTDRKGGFINFACRRPLRS